jgi:mRNA deadenylase 3'-5' endonuclease subunit Ccr4
MKILSWNILAQEFIEPKYYPMIKSILLKKREERLIQIVKKLILYNPDVMLLQEVMNDEYKIIKKVFSPKYFISENYPINWLSEKDNLKLSESGNITLVKKKLSSQVKFTIHSKTTPFVKTEFLYKKSNINIVNIHLDDQSIQNRMKQIKKILSKIPNERYVIIGGDFNEEYSKNNILYKYLKKNNLSPSITKKPTYFIEKPMVIDNIMYKKFNLIKSTVHNGCGDRSTLNINCQIKSYGSDHFPVISYLEII